MIAQVPRVTAFKVLGGHELYLKFKDGKAGRVDLSYLPQLGPIFQPLKQSDYFSQVRLDRILGTIVWPNGADVAPETLHQILVEEADQARPQQRATSAASDSDLTATSANEGGRRRTKAATKAPSSVLRRTSANKRGRKNSDL